MNQYKFTLFTPSNNLIEILRKKSIGWVGIVIWFLLCTVAFIFTLQSLGKLAFFTQQISISQKTIKTIGKNQFSYIVFIGYESLSQRKQSDISLAQLLEDGKPLGPANAPREQIQKIGKGHFSFLKGRLLFSTSDNSDPRKNGRTYTLVLPLTLKKSSLSIIYFLILCLTIFLIFFHRKLLKSIYLKTIENVKIFYNFLGFISILLFAIIVFSIIADTPYWNKDTLFLITFFSYLTIDFVMIFLSNNYTTSLNSHRRIYQALNIFFLVISMWIIIRFTISDTALAYTWDTFRLEPDSSTYLQGISTSSSRTPIYPLFLELFVSQGHYDRSFSNYPRHVDILDKGSPLLLAARAQTLFLIMTIIAFCWASIYLTQSTLLSFSMICLVGEGFIADLRNSILTETLTQSFLFLLLFVFLFFLKNKKSYVLPIAATISGLMYLTRPAGIYGIVIFISMMFLNIINEKRLAKNIFISIAILLITFSVELIPKFVHYNDFIPTSQFMVATISHGFYVAQPEDVELMPNDTSKKILLRFIENRENLKSSLLAKHKSREIISIETLAYSEAHPYTAAIELGIDYDQIRFYKMAKEILNHRYKEHLELITLHYRLTLTSFGNIPQFLGQYGMIWLILVCILLSILLKYPWNCIGITFIFTHLAHLLVVVSFGIPNNRYVTHTEFLIIICALFLVIGIENKLTLFLKTYKSPKSLCHL